MVWSSNDRRGVEPWSIHRVVARDDHTHRQHEGWINLDTTWRKSKLLTNARPRSDRVIRH